VVTPIRDAPAPIKGTTEPSASQAATCENGN
jgi:hypothetical protein